MTSRLRPAPGCVTPHEVVRHRVPVTTPFGETTLLDVLAAAEGHFGSPPSQFEFRQLPLHEESFGMQRVVGPEVLVRFGDRPLAELGLTGRDYVCA